MKPLGAKEKKDLFFQYLVMFTIAAGALLAALFLTRVNPGTSGMDEQTQNLFNKFDKFDKSKPGLEKLIDTVTTEANKIVPQNEEGSFALQTANELINEFEKKQDDINFANNPFAGNVVQLLKLYINSKNDIKTIKRQENATNKLLEDCNGKLEKKQQADELKNILQQSQNTHPAR